MLSPNKFWVQKFWVYKNVEPKKILNQKFCLSKNIFCPEIVLCATVFLVQQFWVLTNLDQQILVQKDFGSKKRIYQNVSPNDISAPKKLGPKSWVKIWSVTVEIQMLPGKMSSRHMESGKDGPQKPTFQVLSKLVQ